MAEPKKILVVDDHFEMLEFLRSMLQLANPEYEVLGVPSAEEGLLELHLTPFDLLISDVRLPGMSGFELVRKAKRMRAGLPVLMITGYASQQGKQEAEELGVYRYFEKPLDTDALLAAVHVLLDADVAKRTTDTAPFTRPETKAMARAEVKENGVARVEEAPPAVPETKEAATERDNAAELQRRLQSLLTDTGAVEALLTEPAGWVLYRAGRGERDVSQLARLLTRSLVNSFELAEALQSAEPFTIQYQAGESVDVYGANIGRDYFLILMFDARARRGRIGTVWVFAQRAVKELRELLPGTGTGRMADAPPGQSEVREQGALQSSEEAHEQGHMPNASGTQASGQQATPRVMETGEFKTRLPQAKPDAEGGTSDVASETGHEDFLRLLREAEEELDIDLDGYWEEAAADARRPAGSGLSFEEAVKLGLLPPDLSD